MPGKYTVSLSQYYQGEVAELTDPVEFEAVVLHNTTLPETDRQELVDFQNKVAELTRVIRGTEKFAYELDERIKYIMQAVLRTPEADIALMKNIEDLTSQMEGIIWKFKGQSPKASREENWPAPPSINDRLNSIVWAHWRSTSPITQTQKDVYNILVEEFPEVLEDLKDISVTKLPEIEKTLEQLDAPWTPGRLPDWIDN